MPGTELSITEGLGGLKVVLLLGDFAWCLRDEWRWKAQVNAGGGGLEVVTLCGL